MTHLSWKTAMKLAALCVVLTVIGSWGHDTVARQDISGFPEPRFPTLPPEPTSVAEAMPYARDLAANPIGTFGAGLGASKPGETVAIVTPSVPENPHLQEAIRRALIERKITPNMIEFVREDRPLFSAVVGVRDWDYARALKAPPSPLHAPRYGREGALDGALEVRGWFSQFGFPTVTQKWLKATRSDLYDFLYPRDDPQYTPPKTDEPNDGTFRHAGGDVLQEYLRKNPEVDGLYWGGSWYQNFEGLGTFANKWRGVSNFTRSTVMSDERSYPGDVWILSETKNIEPIAFVDRAHLTDPEGMDISLEVSQELGQRWAKVIYERGHNHLGPNFATGRYARNAVSYPVTSGEWIPRSPLARWNGVIAGTTNHTGFFPNIQMHFVDGYLSQVGGGGTYGELMRTIFEKFPNINTVTYPFHDRPGYFHLSEVALGTHPKRFRAPAGPGESINTTIEMRGAGYLHIAPGLQLENDPSSSGISDTWQKFVMEHNVPMYHGFHVHTYFSTYRVRLRYTDRWITILERGRMKSLDDPEVRALASRYGNPGEILAKTWYPAIPGINAPGNYSDYARDPRSHHQELNDRDLAKLSKGSQ